jgi:predicted tellurium resistance membrane protein TerC
MKWVIFNFLIAGLLAVDLVYHRKPREIKLKEALQWSFFWIALALCFNVYIYFAEGITAALQFFTGFIVEKSLSIDNLFVFALIFKFFKTPSKEQHKVLYWGVIGAFVMRLIFILVGTALIAKFHWIVYFLGIFLIATGFKLFFQEEKKVSFDKSFFYTTIRKHFPKISTFFLTLLAIEYTDIIFALDSLPAIFAITSDRFIIYTSNVFAILGLRSLYFVLAHYLKLFHTLKYGLAAVLIFVGIKMLLSHFFVIPASITLAIVAAILASCLRPFKEAPKRVK